jgi:hypothetical protein
MNLCQNDFCGCEFYQGEVVGKVYIHIAIILVAIAVSVRVGSEWFIFKDYYPLK